MTTIKLILQFWLFSSFILFVGFLYSKKVKKADWADILWSGLILFFVTILFFYYQNYSYKNIIVYLFVVFWSVRIIYHLLNRTITSLKEDSRYLYYRNLWKNTANLKFFILFQLQNYFVLILTIPFHYIFSQNENLSLIHILPIILWILSWFGVLISDLQLKKFKKTSRSSEICNIGLWRYSRHPNYFFEFLIWLSYPLFLIGNYSLFISLISPMFMYVLLRYVTGVPPLEKIALINKGKLYRDYQENTSVIIPWFKK